MSDETMAEVMNEAVRLIERHKWISYDRPSGLFVWDAARDLASAGLLATPAMKQAVEACVGANATKACENITRPDALRRWYECCDAGRAILAEREARKPKPDSRWEPMRFTEERSALCWVVAEYGDCRGSRRFTEQQARAVAEALNNLEAERGE